MKAFDATVHTLLAQVGYRDNPYFTALHERPFRHEDFVETQIAFSHQVAFFSRAMLIAASRIDGPEGCWPAVANVVDEHHHGETGLAHHHTIREFIRRVSGHPEIDIDARAAWPEVQQNVAMMLGTAATGYHFGLAGLAMIERMFADISDWIAHGVVDDGWLTETELIHYNLHAELDTRHAEELFVVLRAD